MGYVITETSITLKLGKYITLALSAYRSPKCEVDWLSVLMLIVLPIFASKLLRECFDEMPVELFSEQSALLHILNVCLYLCLLNEAMNDSSMLNTSIKLFGIGNLVSFMHSI